jgi:hypothetical protein
MLKTTCELINEWMLLQMHNTKYCLSPDKMEQVVIINEFTHIIIANCLLYLNVGHIYVFTAEITP